MLRTVLGLITSVVTWLAGCAVDVNNRKVPCLHTSVTLVRSCRQNGVHDLRCGGFVPNGRVASG